MKSKAYRDTRGPGVAGVRRMLAIAHDHRPKKAARDGAILRVAYGLGLRRGEIESLNVEYLDLARGTLSVLGKGRTEREFLTLPLNAKQALSAWLAYRAPEDPNAPLFIALDNCTNGARGRASARCHSWLEGGDMAKVERRVWLIALWSLSFVLACGAGFIVELVRPLSAKADIPRACERTPL